ncbi:glycosyltransferase family 4 protein [Actinospongicola halichondriae]|uniref:glycosyltransferase family 4 protein n=1 Tax=Actinospongicola halichondriae TaxID=3236844 RepID=UPI003D560F89
MDIRITNPYCWPQVHRGSEAVMHGLGRWLNANGHEASVLASHSRSSTYEIDGLDYRTVRAPDLRRVYRELGPDLTMIPAMARQLRSSSPDVVHAFTYLDAAAARLARRPLVISYAGIILERSWRGQRINRRIFDRISHGDVVISTPSRACGDHFRETYGIETTVVPYALETATFRLDDVERQPGRIFCAATPDGPRKRADFLVAAFEIVARSRPDATLVFGGRASEETRTRLRAMVDPAVAERITFLGDVDGDEVKREYARASVSALTSIEEAFGMVVIESMAAGTPVVGTHSGALPELIVDGVGGLFDVDDVDECARLLDEQLSGDPREQAQRCQSHAQLYDWDSVGPQMVALYDRVVSPRSRR